MAYEEPEVRVRVRGGRVTALLGVIFVLLIAALILVASSISTVGIGEVAIVIDPLTGHIVYTVRGPRVFLKAPWQRVDVVYTAVDVLDMWTDPGTGRTGDYPSVITYTKDGLEAHVDVTLRWRVDPDRVVTLYKNYPMKDWEHRALAPILRQVVRDIVSEYKGLETIEKRHEIANRIYEEFMKRLGREETLGGAIVVEGLNLRNIDLPRDFKAAVTKKLAAEQLMIAANYNRTRILILANASAESRIIEAEGVAKAKLIEANATKKALEAIASVVEDPETLRVYVMLTELGRIAQQGNVQIVVLTGGGQVVPVYTLPGSKP